MSQKKFALFAALALVCTLLVSGSAVAQEGTPRQPTDDEVNAIARQMYCPVCENTPLDVCPTQACAEWRELIRQKLAAGWSERQIKDYFVEQYGDRVLATPPARGLNWLIYLIPPAAILAGIYILYRSFQAWRQPLPSVQPQGAAGAGPTHGGVLTLPEANDEYIQKMEEELRKL